jgi:hypothetical protein
MHDMGIISDQVAAALLRLLPVSNVPATSDGCLSERNRERAVSFMSAAAGNAMRGRMVHDRVFYTLAVFGGIEAVAALIFAVLIAHDRCRIN